MHKITKAVACATALCFLTTNLASAQTSFPLFGTPDNSALSVKIDKVTIPEELGSIQTQVHEAPEKPFIIVIQDAHAILDAQNNTQALIRFFQEKYGVQIVAFEGGKGKLDPTLLRAFPDPFVKKQVLKQYLEQGELTGLEMAAVFNPQNAGYYGIEDWKLYEENFVAYLRATQNKEAVLAKLGEVKAGLDRERRQVYSGPLNAFHEQVEAFEEEQSNLPAILKYLGTIIANPLSSPHAFRRGSPTKSFGDDIASAYPHLSALLDTMAKDGDLHKESLDASIRQMAEGFRKKAGSKLTKKDAMEFNENYQTYVTGHMDSGAFLKFLVKLAHSQGLKPRLTALMRELLGNAETLSMIKGTKLFDELQRFLAATEEKLTSKPEETALSQKYKEIRFLKDLASLELTRDQWDEYAKAPVEYSKQSAVGESDGLAPALEFYRLARERDGAFHRNLVALLKKEKAKSAIVLAGGFHANGIEKSMQEEGYSYALITPRINSLAGQEVYSEIMQGKLSYKSYLETSFYDAFAKASAVKLFREFNEPDFKKNLKLWRDEVIRQLSKEGRITQASKYTRYIDLLLKAYHDRFGETATLPKTREEILKAVDGELKSFGEEMAQTLWQRLQPKFEVLNSGLQTLMNRKQLTEANVSSLLDQVKGKSPSAVVQAHLGLMPEDRSPTLEEWYKVHRLPAASNASMGNQQTTSLPNASTSQYEKMLRQAAMDAPAPPDDLVNQSSIGRIVNQIRTIGPMVADGEVKLTANAPEEMKKALEKVSRETVATTGQIAKVLLQNVQTQKNFKANAGNAASNQRLRSKAASRSEARAGTLPEDLQNFKKKIDEARSIGRLPSEAWGILEKDENFFIWGEIQQPGALDYLKTVAGSVQMWRGRGFPYNTVKKPGENQASIQKGKLKGKEIYVFQLIQEAAPAPASEVTKPATPKPVALSQSISAQPEETLKSKGGRPIIQSEMLTQGNRKVAEPQPLVNLSKKELSPEERKVVDFLTGSQVAYKFEARIKQGEWMNFKKGVASEKMENETGQAKVEDVDGLQNLALQNFEPNNDRLGFSTYGDYNGDTLKALERVRKTHGAVLAAYAIQESQFENKIHKIVKNSQGDFEEKVVVVTLQTVGNYERSQRTGRAAGGAFVNFLLSEKKFLEIRDTLARNPELIYEAIRRRSPSIYEEYLVKRWGNSDEAEKMKTRQLPIPVLIGKKNAESGSEIVLGALNVIDLNDRDEMYSLRRAEFTRSEARKIPGETTRGVAAPRFLRKEVTQSEAQKAMRVLERYLQQLLELNSKTFEEKRWALMRVMAAYDMSPSALSPDPRDLALLGDGFNRRELQEAIDTLLSKQRPEGLRFMDIFSKLITDRSSEEIEKKRAGLLEAIQTQGIDLNSSTAAGFTVFSAQKIDGEGKLFHGNLNNADGKLLAVVLIQTNKKGEVSEIYLGDGSRQFYRLRSEKEISQRIQEEPGLAKELEVREMIQSKIKTEDLTGSAIPENAGILFGGVLSGERIRKALRRSPGLARVIASEDSFFVSVSGDMLILENDGYANAYFNGSVRSLFYQTGIVPEDDDETLIHEMIHALYHAWQWHVSQDDTPNAKSRAQNKLDRVHRHFFEMKAGQIQNHFGLLKTIAGSKGYARHTNAFMKERKNEGLVDEAFARIAATVLSGKLSHEMNGEEFPITLQDVRLLEDLGFSVDAQYKKEVQTKGAPQDQGTTIDLLRHIEAEKEEDRKLKALGIRPAEKQKTSLPAPALSTTSAVTSTLQLSGDVISHGFFPTPLDFQGVTENLLRAPNMQILLGLEPRAAVEMASFLPRELPAPKKVLQPLFTENGDRHPKEGQTLRSETRKTAELDVEPPGKRSIEVISSNYDIRWTQQAFNGKSNELISQNWPTIRKQLKKVLKGGQNFLDYKHWRNLLSLEFGPSRNPAFRLYFKQLGNQFVIVAAFHHNDIDYPNRPGARYLNAVAEWNIPTLRDNLLPKQTSDQFLREKLGLLIKTESPKVEQKGNEGIGARLAERFARQQGRSETRVNLSDDGSSEVNNGSVNTLPINDESTNDGAAPPVVVYGKDKKHVQVIDGASRVITVGDVHGDFEGLMELLSAAFYLTKKDIQNIKKKLNPKLREAKSIKDKREIIEKIIQIMLPYIKKGDVLGLVGDYVDRGQQNVEVIEFLMGLQGALKNRPGAEASLVLAMGNHDYVFQKFFETYQGDGKDVEEAKLELAKVALKADFSRLAVSEVVSTLEEFFNIYGSIGEMKNLGVFDFFSGLKQLVVVNNYVITHGSVPDISGKDSLDALEGHYDSMVKTEKMDPAWEYVTEWIDDEEHVRKRHQLYDLVEKETGVRPTRLVVGHDPRSGKVGRGTSEKSKDVFFVDGGLTPDYREHSEAPGIMEIRNDGKIIVHEPITEDGRKNRKREIQGTDTPEEVLSRMKVVESSGDQATGDTQPELKLSTRVDIQQPAPKEPVAATFEDFQKFKEWAKQFWESFSDEEVQRQIKKAMQDLAGHQNGKKGLFFLSSTDGKTVQYRLAEGAGLGNDSANDLALIFQKFIDALKEGQVFLDETELNKKISAFLKLLKEITPNKHNRRLTHHTLHELANPDRKLSSKGDSHIAKANAIIKFGATLPPAAGSSDDAYRTFFKELEKDIDADALDKIPPSKVLTPEEAKHFLGVYQSLKKVKANKGQKKAATAARLEELNVFLREFRELRAKTEAVDFSLAPTIDVGDSTDPKPKQDAGVVVASENTETAATATILQNPKQIQNWLEPFLKSLPHSDELLYLHSFGEFEKALNDFFGAPLSQAGIGIYSENPWGEESNRFEGEKSFFENLAKVLNAFAANIRLNDESQPFLGATTPEEKIEKFTALILGMTNHMKQSSPLGETVLKILADDPDAGNKNTLNQLWAWALLASKAELNKDSDNPNPYETLNDWLRKNKRALPDNDAKKLIDLELANNQAAILDFLNQLSVRELVHYWVNPAEEVKGAKIVYAAYQALANKMSSSGNDLLEPGQAEKLLQLDHAFFVSMMGTKKKWPERTALLNFLKKLTTAKAKKKSALKTEAEDEKADLKPESVNEDEGDPLDFDRQTSPKELSSRPPGKISSAFAKIVSATRQSWIPIIGNSALFLLLWAHYWALPLLFGTKLIIGILVVPVIAHAVFLVWSRVDEGIREKSWEPWWNHKAGPIFSSAALVVTLLFTVTTAPVFLSGLMVASLLYLVLHLFTLPPAEKDTAAVEEERESLHDQVNHYLVTRILLAGIFIVTFVPFVLAAFMAPSLVLLIPFGFLAIASAAGYLFLSFLPLSPSETKAARWATWAKRLVAAAVIASALYYGGSKLKSKSVTVPRDEPVAQLIAPAAPPALAKKAALPAAPKEAVPPIEVVPQKEAPVVAPMPVAPEPELKKEPERVEKTELEKERDHLMTRLDAWLTKDYGPDAERHYKFIQPLLVGKDKRGMSFAEFKALDEKWTPEFKQAMKEKLTEAFLLIRENDPELYKNITSNKGIRHILITLARFPGVAIREADHSIVLGINPFGKKMNVRDFAMLLAHEGGHLHGAPWGGIENLRSHVTEENRVRKSNLLLAEKLFGKNNPVYLSLLLEIEQVDRDIYAQEKTFNIAKLGLMARWLSAEEGAENEMKNTADSFRDFSISRIYDHMRAFVKHSQNKRGEYPIFLGVTSVQNRGKVGGRAETLIRFQYRLGLSNQRFNVLMNQKGEIVRDKTRSETRAAVKRWILPQAVIESAGNPEIAAKWIARIKGNREAFDAARLDQLSGLGLSADELGQMGWLDATPSLADRHQVGMVIGGGKPAAYVDMEQETFFEQKGKRQALLDRAGLGVVSKHASRSFWERAEDAFFGFLRKWIAPRGGVPVVEVLYFDYNHVRQVMEDLSDADREKLDIGQPRNLSKEDIDALMGRVLNEYRYEPLFRKLLGVLLGYGSESVDGYVDDRTRLVNLGNLMRYLESQGLPPFYSLDLVARFPNFSVPAALNQMDDGINRLLAMQKGDVTFDRFMASLQQPKKQKGDSHPKEGQAFRSETRSLRGLFWETYRNLTLGWRGEIKDPNEIFTLLGDRQRGLLFSIMPINLQNSRGPATERARAIVDKFNMFSIHGNLVLDKQTGQVIVITGESGTGKSSTSANLLQNKERFQFVMDDSIVAYIKDGNLFAGAGALPVYFSGFKFRPGENAAMVTYAGVHEQKFGFFPVEAVVYLSSSPDIQNQKIEARKLDENFEKIAEDDAVPTPIEKVKAILGLENLLGVNVVVPPFRKGARDYPAVAAAVVDALAVRSETRSANKTFDTTGEVQEPLIGPLSSQIVWNQDVFSKMSLQDRKKLKTVLTHGDDRLTLLAETFLNLSDKAKRIAPISYFFRIIFRLLQRIQRFLAGLFNWPYVSGEYEYSRTINFKLSDPVEINGRIFRTVKIKGGRIPARGEIIAFKQAGNLQPDVTFVMRDVAGRMQPSLEKAQDKPYRTESAAKGKHEFYATQAMGDAGMLTNAAVAYGISKKQFQGEPVGYFVSLLTDEKDERFFETVRKQVMPAYKKSEKGVLTGEEKKKLKNWLQQHFEEYGTALRRLNESFIHKFPHSGNVNLEPQGFNFQDNDAVIPVSTLGEAQRLGYRMNDVFQLLQAVHEFEMTQFPDGIPIRLYGKRQVEVVEFLKSIGVDLKKMTLKGYFQTMSGDPKIEQIETSQTLEQLFLAANKPIDGNHPIAKLFIEEFSSPVRSEARSEKLMSRRRFLAASVLGVTGAVFSGLRQGGGPGQADLSKTQQIQSIVSRVFEWMGKNSALGNDAEFQEVLGAIGRGETGKLSRLIRNMRVETPPEGLAFAPGWQQNGIIFISKKYLDDLFAQAGVDPLSELSKETAMTAFFQEMRDWDRRGFHGFENSKEDVLINAVLMPLISLIAHEAMHVRQQERGDLAGYEGRWGDGVSGLRELEAYRFGKKAEAGLGMALGLIQQIDFARANLTQDFFEHPSQLAGSAQDSENRILHFLEDARKAAVNKNLALYERNMAEAALYLMTLLKTISSNEALTLAPFRQRIQDQFQSTLRAFRGSSMRLSDAALKSGLPMIEAGLEQTSQMTAGAFFERLQNSGFSPRYFERYLRSETRSMPDEERNAGGTFTPGEVLWHKWRGRLEVQKIRNENGKIKVTVTSLAPTWVAGSDYGGGGTRKIQWETFDLEAGDLAANAVPEQEEARYKEFLEKTAAEMYPLDWAISMFGLNAFRLRLGASSTKASAAYFEENKPLSGEYGEIFTALFKKYFPEEFARLLQEAGKAAETTANSKKKIPVSGFFLGQALKYLEMELRNESSWRTSKKETVPKLRKETQFLKELFEKIFRSSGEDLVKTGVLISLKSEKNPTRKTGPWSFWLTGSNTLWWKSRPVAEVDEYYRYKLLREGLTAIMNDEEKKAYENSSKEFRAALYPFYALDDSSGKGKTDPWTLLIRAAEFNPKAAAKLVPLFKEQLLEFIRSHGIQVLTIIPSGEPEFNHMLPFLEEFKKDPDFSNLIILNAGLKKTGETKKQKYMGAFFDRARNISGAFEAEESVQLPNGQNLNLKGQKVLVLDRVKGSGLTLEDARRALREAGAIPFTLAFAATGEGSLSSSPPFVSFDGNEFHVPETPEEYALATFASPLKGSEDKLDAIKKAKEWLKLNGPEIDEAKVKKMLTALIALLGSELSGQTGPDVKIGVLDALVNFLIDSRDRQENFKNERKEIFEQISALAQLDKMGTERVETSEDVRFAAMEAMGKLGAESKPFLTALFTALSYTDINTKKQRPALLKTIKIILKAMADQNNQLEPETAQDLLHRIDKPGTSPTGQTGSRLKNTDKDELEKMIQALTRSESRSAESENEMTRFLEDIKPIVEEIIARDYVQRFWGLTQHLKGLTGHAIGELPDYMRGVKKFKSVAEAAKIIEDLTEELELELIKDRKSSVKYFTDPETYQVGNMLAPLTDSEKEDYRDLLNQLKWAFYDYDRQSHLFPPGSLDFRFIAQTDASDMPVPGTLKVIIGDEEIKLPANEDERKPALQKVAQALNRTQKSRKHETYAWVDASGKFWIQYIANRKGEAVKKSVDFYGSKVEATRKILEVSTPITPRLFRSELRQTVRQRVISHGDVHGELEGLKEDLRQAALIDDQGHWIGGTDIFVQVGDVIDRGPQSREAYEYLGKLQEEARAANGDVIRLVGNHEMMLLEGLLGNDQKASKTLFNWFQNLTSEEKAELMREMNKQRGQRSLKKAIEEKYGKLVKQMVTDIKNGNLKAAHVIDGRLRVHAGLRSKMREILKKEIVQNLKAESSKIATQQISDYINDIFRKAFEPEKEDFSHPIFGKEGPFWVRGAMESAGAGEIPQDFGHTPQASPVVASPSVRRVNVDVGLFEGYGGGRGFVEFTKGGGIIAHRKNKNGNWEQEVLKKDEEIPLDTSKEEIDSIYNELVQTLEFWANGGITMAFDIRERLEPASKKYGMENLRNNERWVEVSALEEFFRHLKKKDPDYHKAEKAAGNFKAAKGDGKVLNFMMRILFPPLPKVQTVKRVSPDKDRNVLSTELGKLSGKNSKNRDLESRTAFTKVLEQLENPDNRNKIKEVWVARDGKDDIAGIFVELKSGEVYKAVLGESKPDNPIRNKMKEKISEGKSPVTPGRVVWADIEGFDFEVTENELEGLPHFQGQPSKSIVREFLTRHPDIVANSKKLPSLHFSSNGENSVIIKGRAYTAAGETRDFEIEVFNKGVSDENRIQKKPKGRWYGISEQNRPKENQTGIDLDEVNAAIQAVSREAGNPEGGIRTVFALAGYPIPPHGTIHVQAVPTAAGSQSRSYDLVAEDAQGNVQARVRILIAKDKQALIAMQENDKKITKEFERLRYSKSENELLRSLPNVEFKYTQNNKNGGAIAVYVPADSSSDVLGESNPIQDESKHNTPPPESTVTENDARKVRFSARKKVVPSFSVGKKANRPVPSKEKRQLAVKDQAWKIASKTVGVLSEVKEKDIQDYQKNRGQFLVDRNILARAEFESEDKIKMTVTLTPIGKDKEGKPYNVSVYKEDLERPSFTTDFEDLIKIAIGKLMDQEIEQRKKAAYKAEVADVEKAPKTVVDVMSNPDAKKIILAVAKDWYRIMHREHPFVSETPDSLKNFAKRGIRPREHSAGRDDVALIDLPGGNMSVPLSEPLWTLPISPINKKLAQLDTPEKLEIFLEEFNALPSEAKSKQPKQAAKSEVRVVQTKDYLPSGIDIVNRLAGAEGEDEKGILAQAIKDWESQAQGQIKSDVNQFIERIHQILLKEAQNPEFPRGEDFLSLLMPSVVPGQQTNFEKTVQAELKELFGNVEVTPNDVNFQALLWRIRNAVTSQVVSAITNVDFGLADAAKGIKQSQIDGLNKRLDQVIATLANAEVHLVFIIDFPESDIVKEVLADFSSLIDQLIILTEKNQHLQRGDWKAFHLTTLKYDRANPDPAIEKAKKSAYGANLAFAFTAKNNELSPELLRNQNAMYAFIRKLPDLNFQKLAYKAAATLLTELSAVLPEDRNNKFNDLLKKKNGDLAFLGNSFSIDEKTGVISLNSVGFLKDLAGFQAVQHSA